jgi:hemerythrin superfamily protein
MNATRFLAAQHRAIESLFEQVANETRRQVRGRAASRLTEELIAHMAAEEAIFYPAARAALGPTQGPREPGDSPVDEHFMLRAQLRRVLATNIHTPAFAPRLEALRTLFRHHVDAEENEFFPRVEAVVPASRLEALGVAVEGARPRVWIVTTENHAAMLSMRAARESGHGVRLPSLTEN